jgi:hypothetical protein
LAATTDAVRLGARRNHSTPTPKEHPLRFTLHIDSNNAAMLDDPEAELSRIFTDVRQRIGVGHRRGQTTDSNGNVVGAWNYVEGDTA